VTPTALPIRNETAPYVARHGHGYSRFHHGSHGILVELLQFVPSKDPIKISRLTLKNDSGRVRRLSVTAYAEWVLGSSRSASAPYLITELDSKTRAVFVVSAWAGEFGGRVAFADLDGTQVSVTGDRTEFLCRNGRLSIRPRWSKATRFLEGWEQSRFHARPCKPRLHCAPGASEEIVFFLGQAENREQARELLSRYRTADLDAILSEVTGQWTTFSKPYRSAHPRRTWTSHEIVGYSTRHWRLVSGTLAAFYQLSVRTVSATNSRMGWLCV